MCGNAGVVVDGEQVEADAVVIAMGPWSGQAAKWLPVPDITGQKYASIVLRPEEDISNHMLFLSYKTTSGRAAYPLLSFHSHAVFIGFGKALGYRRGLVSSLCKSVRERSMR